MKYTKANMSDLTKVLDKQADRVKLDQGFRQIFEARLLCLKNQFMEQRHEYRVGYSLTQSILELTTQVYKMLEAELNRSMHKIRRSVMESKLDPCGLDPLLVVKKKRTPKAWK